MNKDSIMIMYLRNRNVSMQEVELLNSLPKNSCLLWYKKLGLNKVEKYIHNGIYYRTISTSQDLDVTIISRMRDDIQ
jgi:hypothetical protein